MSASRAGRRFPRVVMRADLAVTAGQQRPQNRGRTRVGRHRMRDHIRRPNAMPREQRMQPRQRVDVLEALVQPRLGVPLVVALGVDA